MPVTGTGYPKSEKRGRDVVSSVKKKKKEEKKESSFFKFEIIMERLYGVVKVIRTTGAK